MTINLRQEQLADYREVEEITREAFWGQGRPRCDEHYLAHLLRKSACFVPELDYVAEINGRLVGNVMFSKAKIVTPDGIEHEVLSFGPISVLPEYQNKGVGKALLRRTVEEAKKLGYSAIVIFGEPDYYPRLGFKRAAEFELLTAWGGTLDAFMAMPLYGGAFDGLAGGVFHEDSVYHVNEQKAYEFDKQFPNKTEHKPLQIEILPAIMLKELQPIFTKKEIKLIDDLRKLSGREIAALPGMCPEWYAVIDEYLIKDGSTARVWHE